MAVTGTACATERQAPPVGDELECTLAKPVYPKEAIADRAAGRAMVRLKVGESGDVEYAAIEQSSSDARLDRAAVEAIARMRCRPADGSALPFRLPVTTVQPIDFELSQPAMTE
ncbi:hypothetical protein BKK80_34590 (plasmid) [Cupriavidus malaysiensis]|uniref:TonB C-terminal domain-containing protein n=2 Tax=Cupriavidus malaysiensis TaxID=367825 RepID=A0ABN4TYT7_9BURK|nr:hypothetical protein BKK80_34590 [Cupriavidus malaysiensis]